MLTQVEKTCNQILCGLYSHLGQSWRAVRETVSENVKISKQSIRKN